MKTPQVKTHFFEFEFITQRSRGPGGQHVNKTNSSVQLRWDFGRSSLLTEEQKSIISFKLYGMINSEGTLYLRSDTHRELDKNKKETLEKLQLALDKAFYKPKKRFKTRPTLSSQKKRVEHKRKHSDLKKGRKKINNSSSSFD